MELHLEAVSFEVADAVKVGGFRAGLLQRDPLQEASWGGRPVEPQHGRNRQRFDLVTADPDGNEFSLRARRRTTARPTVG